MADITLTCTHCGATLTFSQYAKPEGLACPKCQAPLSMPDAEPSIPDRFLPQHIRQAKAEAAAREAANPGKTNVRLESISSQIHQKKRRVRFDSFMPTVKAAVLFVVLTAILAYLRYFDGYQLFLAKDELDLLRLGGTVAILFFHVSIVIEALTNDFLTGILCLVVPGYSLYYLFTESDSFWLRAIMMSLIIVFGPDFVFYVRDYAMGAYNFINHWLEAGGTPEPTTRLK
jgi:hypothetical protein